MRKVKIYIYNLSVIRILNNKKNILLLILLYFLILVYVRPLKRFAIQTGYLMITPYIYPFLLTDTNFLIIFTLGIIYYYSTIPFVNRWNGYYILRIGRERWFLEQIKHIIISAILVTLITILGTNIALIPFWHLDLGWGKVLYTLAKTDAKKMCDLFWTLSAQFMSYNTPIKSMFISIIISFLGIIFIGILMFTCSIVFSRTISIIIANSLVIYSSLIVYIKNIPERLLVITSPISWMKIANYGITKYGYKAAPSIFFTLCLYIFLILLLICLANYKLKKKDFIWWNEDEWGYRN